MPNINKHKEISKIVVIYALFGSAWIFFSDTILGWFIHDPEIMTKIAVFKGLLFIACTSTLLYFLIARLSARIKQSTQALRESEERFRLAMEATSDGFWDWNIEKGEIYFSPAYTRMLGYKPEEFHDKADSWTEMIHQEDRERVLSAKQDCVEGRRPGFELEYRIKTRDGSMKWLVGRAKVVSHDADGRARRMLGTHIDITERKTAETALRASEERNRLLADLLRSSSQPFVAAKPDGRITFVNPAACSLFGYTHDEMLEMSWNDDLTPPEWKAATTGMMTRLMGSGEPVCFEKEYFHKNGRRIPVELLAHVRRNDMGETELFYSFITDLTERKRLEKEAEDLNLQLLQTQKIESIGRLAGGVAHDFNNMLLVILGHSEMAMDQLDPSQPLYADLKEIRKAADRSADITRQLLTFARKQTVIPKVLDINERVEGMLTMLRRLIGENIELEWLPGAALWPVKIDPSQIDQIMANLCVNARDAIAGIGKIIVETGNSTLHEDYCASNAGFIPGEFVRIVVSDNGIGMDEETRSHIFEPFFTTKDIGEGTGLGLATVYGAVKQNKGFINVYSEPGRATTFTIYLPRYKGDTGTAQPVAEPACGGNETILLVEDEPTILKMTATMLESLGYTVLAAPSPGEALRRIGEFPGKIDLLLTDVIMPEMNGRDLAELLLKKQSTMKCLFMSGYTANIITDQGVLDDGVNFIQKPFSKTELATKIRDVLDIDSAQGDLS